MILFFIDGRVIRLQINTRGSFYSEHQWHPKRGSMSLKLTDRLYSVGKKINANISDTRPTLTRLIAAPPHKKKI